MYNQDFLLESSVKGPTRLYTPTITYTHPYSLHIYIYTLQHASAHIPPQRSSGVRPRSKTFEEYEKETDDAWDDREEEFSDSLPSELEVQQLGPLGKEGGEEGGGRRNQSNSRGKGKSVCVCVSWSQSWQLCVTAFVS